MIASSAWTITSVSFIMALSGALMPGPLLTYTIARTVQAPRRGFLVGPLVIAGHGALEMVILCALVFGVTEFLKAPTVIKAIGVAGAILLAYMGVGLLREVFQKRAVDPLAVDERQAGSLVSRMNPVLAGILLSLSNPYWWIWWVTAGSATLIRFGVSLRAWQGILLFFIGHEAGDLIWYFAVSLLTHFGKRRLSRRFYNAILAVCGVAIIAFGLYLGISPFLRNG
jgi:threonine/homoserine/homoserine lactone efflux protein